MVFYGAFELTVEMPKTRVGPIDLHYITVGQGPDVVMVHGFLGNLAVWHLQIVPALRDRLRLTTYDLRGHGFSDVTKNSYTSADLADDLRGLLDNLGITRPSLVGHSFGAVVCLHFALRYPDRVGKLVLIEPALSSAMQDIKNENWNGWDYWVSKLTEAGFAVPAEKRTELRYLLDLSIATPKLNGPFRSQRRNQEVLQHLLHHTSLIDDSLEVGDLTPDALREITASVLLIYGDQSPFLDSCDTLRTSLRNATTCVLTDSDHFPLVNRADIVSTHIRDFVR